MCWVLSDEMHLFILQHCCSPQRYTTYQKILWPLGRGIVDPHSENHDEVWRGSFRQRHCHTHTGQVWPLHNLLLSVSFLVLCQIPKPRMVYSDSQFNSGCQFGSTDHRGVVVTEAGAGSSWPHDICSQEAGRDRHWYLAHLLIIHPSPLAHGRVLPIFRVGQN